jgi:hypothetical protein
MCFLIGRGSARSRISTVLRIAMIAGPLHLLTAAPGCNYQSQGEGPGHRQQQLALTPQQELKIGREA